MVYSRLGSHYSKTLNPRVVDIGEIASSMQCLLSCCSVPGPVLGTGHQGTGLGSSCLVGLGERALEGLQLVAFCRAALLLLLVKT